MINEAHIIWSDYHLIRTYGGGVFRCHEARKLLTSTQLMITPPLCIGTWWVSVNLAVFLISQGGLLQGGAM